METGVAAGERAEVRAGADSNPAPDRGGTQGQMRDETGAAAQRDRRGAAGHRAGVDDAAVAGSADGRAGRRAEIRPAVGAARERCRGRVVEAARHLAGNRPLPSLGSGGGGMGQEQ